MYIIYEWYNQQVHECQLSSTLLVKYRMFISVRAQMERLHAAVTLQKSISHSSPDDYTMRCHKSSQPMMSVCDVMCSANWWCQCDVMCSVNWWCHNVMACVQPTGDVTMWCHVFSQQIVSQCDVTCSVNWFDDFITIYRITLNRRACLNKCAPQ